MTADNVQDRAAPLRIVLFSASYLPRVGGLETAVSRLAREFQRAGHHVTVVTNRYPRRLARFEEIEGVPVHRILFPSPIVPRSEWGRTHMGKYLLLLPLAPWSLLRLALLLRALRPDVVNVHYLSSPSVYIVALSWLRVLPTRLVVSCHGSDLTTVPYPTGSSVLSRWVLSRAQAITACSTDLAGYVARMTSRIPTGKVVAVFNGADADEFDGATPYTHPRPYILGVGRLIDKKGFHFLIEALSLLHGRGYDCDLIIAGSGPREDSLRALASHLGLTDHVFFEGTAGRARLGALYHGCVVFAFAPVWEGFGIVSLEAMSCARPVVATRTGGIPEVVLDGATGLLARSGDPADLADKLAVLLSDPARADAMGRRGRERLLEHFTWPAVAARYLDTFRSPAVDAREMRPDGRGPEASTAGRLGHRARLARLEQRVPGTPILMYHQVAPAGTAGVKPGLLVTPEEFARQMRLLYRFGWRTIRLTEMVDLLETNAPLPRRRFVLTFDDALLGVARYAAPILTDLGFTSTIFVPTGLVGTCRALDGGPDHPDKAVMTWDDLRRLRAMGHDIGAHTRTHPHLPRLSPVDAMAEITGSRDDIAAALGERPGVFAYPYGEWTPTVAALVHESGFAAACATTFGRANIGAHRYALPRISVSVDLNLARFAYRIACADRIARRIDAANERSTASTDGRSA